MAFRELTSEEIQGLVGTRHATGGFEYPPNGLQPYYRWLVSALHLLGGASGGGLRVERDDATETTVRVAPGRATIDGVVVAWGGGTAELGGFNNDTAYVWLHDAGGGVGGVGTGAAGSGWPVTGHLKLAEVTLSAGVITGIIDRRYEAAFAGGIDGATAGKLTRYSITLHTQGNIASPSRVRIQLQDFYGRAVSGADYLRVRVCDAGGYAGATAATIAVVGPNTTVAETVTANKDLVLKSDGSGLFEVDVTNGVPSTVTVRVGAATFTARRGDYTATLDVTHT